MIDEEKIRDKAIRRLLKASDLAYKMMSDERIDVKTRQAWFKRYTDSVRTLSQILKAREEKDWENRIYQMEEYRKKQNTSVASPGLHSQPREESQS